MLAAVQAGRKTVTRRRLPLGLPIQQEPSRYQYCGMVKEGALFEDPQAQMIPPVPCPFGQPGDILQVQEDPALRLQVVSLRAEQVRCLTEADALAEGIRSLEQGGQIQWGGVETDAVGELQWFNTPIAAFQNLLESIYPTAWSRNEWMWVVEFSRLI
ncbi:hypothetical protein [Hymenobacter sp. DG01]|uniref:hypothetical protein n=1 Tax=Hymenobacter sp. DG01 TaxID=2584940 RepID=UPI0011229EDE|nr:hypothetical protein [Hymenobacter sp. DG01]